MLGRTQETTIQYIAAKQYHSPAPISAEALKVRAVLLARGLETPLIENGLSREQKLHAHSTGIY